MSIESKIEAIASARNTIRNKMRVAGQASTTDKLSTLATNLSIGIDTSDADATAANIDSGKTAYVNGSKITGTSTKTDTSDATLSSNANLLSGNTAYSKGTKYTGSMANRGTITTQKLNAGQSYTIPNGYHSGSGKVQANSLASQTAGTATAADIIKGKTAWVGGVMITGTYEPIGPGNLKSFSEATDEQITTMLTLVRNGSITYNDLVSAGWTVGAERPVHLSAMAANGVGESHVEQDQTLVILHGSDMFDLSDSGKNIFVIGLKNILANGTTREAGYINSTNTNVGGWNSSARRPWCDNVFKAALPAEVQEWFKKFKYKVSAGNKSDTIETLENYFTLSSEIEVFGSTTYSKSGEGTQMDYYKTSDNRKKYPGDLSASAISWVTRSPSSSNVSSFCGVGSSGSNSSVYAGSAYGLAPFGCV